jgi:hypothetical protein
VYDMLAGRQEEIEGTSVSGSNGDLLELESDGRFCSLMRCNMNANRCEGHNGF